MKKIEKNIYHDEKNNIYRVKLMADGKRYENSFTSLEKAQKYKYATTNKIALAAQRKAKKISDYVEIYLQAREAEGIAPTTLRYYRYILRILEEEAGQYNPKKMEPYDWHQVFLRMREKLNIQKNNTWNKHIDAIAAMLSFFGIPFKKKNYKVAKETSNRRNFTPEEIERFLTVAKETLDDTFYALCIMPGRVKK